MMQSFTFDNVVVIVWSNSDENGWLPKGWYYKVVGGTKVFGAFDSYTDAVEDLHTVFDN
jgi:hypothetical protein